MDKNKSHNPTSKRQDSKPYKNAFAKL